ncbi:uncharacterized protein N7482_004521 [Penicillium canariense]|uniref:Uncharacterized protein n=1 Tax=Penicillium canariense TaxID=189055 RepID=A0A9W9LPM9_9EURO|nr:uncharacterized protein N7482_004521 [Penicillium canariense]KAJ5168927.1 hypothetical protein N7482_004521 [Penicillium canariense]
MSSNTNRPSPPENNIDRFLRMRKEMCDKLVRWNMNLIGDPGISRIMSTRVAQLLNEFDEFTTLTFEIWSSWIMSDNDREGLTACFRTKVDCIREHMVTLIRELDTPPLYYHRAELAEVMSMLAVSIGRLHYRKQVDDEVRRMRDAAREMNHRVVTSPTYLGPHLATVWDNIFGTIECGCEYCGTD